MTMTLTEVNYHLAALSRDIDDVVRNVDNLQRRRRRGVELNGQLSHLERALAELPASPDVTETSERLAAIGQRLLTMLLTMLFVEPSDSDQFAAAAASRAAWKAENPTTEQNGD